MFKKLCIFGILSVWLSFGVINPAHAESGDNAQQPEKQARTQPTENRDIAPCFASDFPATVEAKMQALQTQSDELNAKVESREITAEEAAELRNTALASQPTDLDIESCAKERAETAKLQKLLDGVNLQILDAANVTLTQFHHFSPQQIARFPFVKALASPKDGTSSEALDPDLISLLLDTVEQHEKAEQYRILYDGDKPEEQELGDLFMFDMLKGDAPNDDTFAETFRKEKEFAQGVTIVPQKNIKMISADTELPITITNHLAIPVKFDLSLSFYDVDQTQNVTETLTLEANQNRIYGAKSAKRTVSDINVFVTLSAVGSPDALSSENFDVDYVPQVGNGVTVVFYLAIAGLIIGGAIRLVRRGRSDARTRSTEPPL